MPLAEGSASRHSDASMWWSTVPDFRAWADEARSIDARAVLEHGDTGGRHPSSAALALLRDTTITTAEICDAASRRIASRTPRLHTFVPLYTTNHCDSECKMCAMRKGNTRLVRRFAGKKLIEEQLRILYHHEHVRGVGFLTGEYQDPYTRASNAFRIGWAIRTALDMGFQRIYFNIGSLVPEEIDVLADWLGVDDPVTMCVFQETYDRATYARFMGSDTRYPKADYDQRIRSFDHWLDAGFRYVNPGVLVGLHDSLEEEVAHLVAHATHLAGRGAVVDLSMPRMRPAHGTRNACGVDEDRYLRAMATAAFLCPDQRIVLTVRESEEFQRKAIGLCGVFSPGSPDVAPYRSGEQARNEARTSQFLVADLRRPREILGELQANGHRVEYFAEPAPSNPFST